MKYRLRWARLSHNDKPQYVANIDMDFGFSSYEDGPHIITRLISARYYLRGNKSHGLKYEEPCVYKIEPL